MSEPQTKDPILSSLCEPQREAVTHESGPLLIIAGPGSGKTRVITHRIAWLIANRGVAPGQIMAVTFTRKAANEMRRRANELTDGLSGGCKISTFHSFGATLLRQYPEQVGLTSSFTIFDDDDRQRLLKNCIKELDISFPGALSRAGTVISRSKQNDVSPEQYKRDPDARYPWHDAIASVYARYEEELGMANAVDFDDLLLKPVHLLATDSDVRAEVRSRFLHVLVDEFQDTNPLQLQLSMLITDDHDNICVVGDPNQSIYSWRFANIENILNFHKYYPKCRRIFLDQSFRSTGIILAAASAVINHNSERFSNKLWTANEQGARITSYQARDPDAEAAYTLNEVQQLSSNYSLNNVAVLCRTSAQFRILEVTATKAGIPYELVGGVPFYARTEIKDLLAYVRLLVNHDDGLALERVINKPRRKLGAKAVATLQNASASARQTPFELLMSIKQAEDAPDALQPYAKPLLVFANLIRQLKSDADQLYPAELLMKIYTDSGYKEMLEQQEDEEAKERIELVYELMALAAGYADGPPAEALLDFLSDVTLEADRTQAQAATATQGDRLTFITMHRSKGLEFPVVFMLGMEEGIMPHHRSMDSPKEYEEERRLCYVSMTRAIKKLYLVRAKMRPWGTMRQVRRDTYLPDSLPSKFIAEIPPELILHLNPGRAARRGGLPPQALPSYLAGGSKPNATPEVTDAIKAGTRIRHPSLGEAVVVSTKLVGGDLEVTAKFADDTERRFMQSYAGLVPL